MQSRPGAFLNNTITVMKLEMTIEEAYKVDVLTLLEDLGKKLAPDGVVRVRKESGMLYAEIE